MKFEIIKTKKISIMCNIFVLCIFMLFGCSKIENSADCRSWDNLSLYSPKIMATKLGYDSKYQISREFTGLVKDKYGRMSYYLIGNLKKDEMFYVEHGSGGDKYHLSKVFADKDGYLVKNYYLQDYLVDGRRRSYYFDKSGNCVFDKDVVFDKNTKSNKRIWNDTNSFHFGEHGYLTYRIDLKEPEKQIKAKWKKNEDGIYQHMNVNGEIDKNSILTKNDERYYVDNNGLMVKNFYLQDFNTGNGVFDYYFDSTGKLVHGEKTIVYIDENTPSNKPIDGSYKLLIKASHVQQKIKLSSSENNSNIKNAIKDVENLEKNLYRNIYNTKKIIDSMQEGDNIKFGHYYKDNNSDFELFNNMEENLEWVLLDKNDENGTALLITKNIIDCRHFDDLDVYYKISNLNKNNFTEYNNSLYLWLNETFIKTAFNKDERSILLDNPSHWNRKIFLLNLDECIKYFGKEDIDGMNKKAVAYGTDYAISQGLEVSTKDVWYKGCGSYWTSTINNDTGDVVCVGQYGHYYELGQDYFLENGDGVRPAIFIKYK